MPVASASAKVASPSDAAAERAMAAERAADAQLAERAIDAEVERTLQVASRQGLMLGVAIFSVLAAIGAAGLLRTVRVPLGLVAFATLFLLGTHYAAKHRALSRPRLRLAMLLCVSMPTLGFAGAWLELPNGMASYVLGAFQVAYVYFVALSGVLLDVRLSRLCGWVAGAQLLICVALSLPALTAHFHSDDPILVEDVLSPGIWLIKALLVVATGYLVGELGRMVRRLIRAALSEERDKRRISGLFSQYVSPEVKDAIVAHRTNARGERVTVAVLFSDLRGFTSISESSNPQQLFDDLNAYFDAVVRPISNHGGIVDKFIGDAVMAVFGGLQTLDNPAESALMAAIAMRQALDEHNRVRQFEGKPRWDHGIGLDYGDVLQGPVGSSERKEFTVIGDTVNTAARLEPATKSLGMPIAFSGAFFDRLGPQWQAQCERVTELQVKGRAQAVRVYGYRMPEPKTP